MAVSVRGAIDDPTGAVSGRGPGAAVRARGLPSALHVCWQVPAWSVVSLGLPRRVGAVAVDVEPEVFWDGGSPAHRAGLRPAFVLLLTAVFVYAGGSLVVAT